MLDSRDQTTKLWTLSFDSSLTINGAEFGIVITSLMGERLQYAVQLQFPAMTMSPNMKTFWHGYESWQT